MGKWFGKIGYAITGETEPGLWEDTIVERQYYGDITSDRRKRQTSNEVNDNITLSNVISIIADPFAYENCSNMAYAEIMGTKWKITDICWKDCRRMDLRSRSTISAVAILL